MNEEQGEVSVLSKCRCRLVGDIGVGYQQGNYYLDFY